jgi:NCS1 family nucleobase:cation symporter-1
MAIGAVAILGTAATIFGHDLIHSFTRHMSWLGGLAILACLAWIIWQHPHLDLHAAPPLTIAALLGAISTSVLWQIAYAPYVSDYSRYLPADTGPRPAFWMSFWGCALGSIVPMALGALLGSLFPGQEIAQSLAAGSGPFGAFAVAVLTLSIAAASAISLYCAVLAAIAIIQTFAPAWQARARARTVISLVLALIAVAMALLAGPHFMETYTNFLLLLLYVMAPWTAINLVDYYLIRHGSYDVASFLQADGGIYGLYNVPALVSYAVGIVIQIPFVANGLYTGPIARRLDGADLSWIAGLLVTSLLYYAIERLGSARRAGR